MALYSKLLIALTLMGLSSVANAGIIYDIKDGVLAGASGVEIGGQLYNVTFEDSCVAAYSGCDGSLFDFVTEQSAIAALDALFSQVLVDDVIINEIEYDFRSDANQIQYCNRSTTCEVFVPYKDNLNGSVRSAWYHITNGKVYKGHTKYTSRKDYGINSDTLAFTNFKLMSVPEPSSLTIFILVMTGLGFYRKKQN